MELHQFFLYLAIILITARLFSEIAGRYGIPTVIGELLAGLLLGPSLLGWVTPDETMKLLAEIGIILLLFEVGMDTDLFRLAKSGIKPIVVAVVGFVLPFALGYAVCRWGFDLNNLVSLFIGGTLTATSIGITVRVLDDLGQRQADEAQIVRLEAQAPLSGGESWRDLLRAGEAHTGRTGLSAWQTRWLVPSGSPMQADRPRPAGDGR